MALKISNSSLFTNHYLVVQSDGIKYCETSLMGGKRRFRFDEIECILLGVDSKLAFQVGQEVFSISTDPTNKKHQQAIAALVGAVQRAGERWTGASA